MQLMTQIPLLAEEGCREAAGWSVRRNVAAGLTTSSAPFSRVHPSSARRGMLFLWFSIRSILELPNLSQHAVWAFQQSRRRVIRLSVLREASSHPEFLPDVFNKELPLDAGSLQRYQRVGLKRPGLDFSIGILHVHVEIAVRILPIDFRQRAGEVSAGRRVKLGCERMMRIRGNCREQHNSRD